MKPEIKSRTKKRKGKGYSIKELVDANIDTKDLPKLGIRIDPRRKTIYPKNIESLKELKELLKKPKAPDKKPEKAKTAGPPTTPATKPAKNPAKTAKKVTQ